MKIVVLEIYHYHRNRVSNVEIEVFETKDTCKEYVNKYFEQINYENFVENNYTEGGWILNEYREDYMYNVSEKTVK
jgi:hypothetical protein